MTYMICSRLSLAQMKSCSKINELHLYTVYTKTPNLASNHVLVVCVVVSNKFLVVMFTSAILQKNLIMVSMTSLFTKLFQYFQHPYPGPRMQARFQSHW